MDLQFIIDNVNTSILVLISALVIMWIVWLSVAIFKWLKILFANIFSNKKRYDDLSYETVKKQLDKASESDTEEKKK